MTANADLRCLANRKADMLMARLAVREVKGDLRQRLTSALRIQGEARVLRNFVK